MLASGETGNPYIDNLEKRDKMLGAENIRLHAAIDRVRLICLGEETVKVSDINAALNATWKK